MNALDATNNLYANMLSGLVITLVAYSALVTVLIGTAPQTILNICRVTMFMLIVLRLSDYIYWRRNKPTIENYHPFSLRFKTLNICTAIVWAGTACWLSQYQGIEYQYITLLMLGSMTGGAVNVLSPSKLLVLSYTALLLFPISITSLLSDNPSLNIVGLLGIAYALIMLPVCKRAYGLAKENIQAKNQELFLRKEIEKERNEMASMNNTLVQTKLSLDQANADLEQKVKDRTIQIYRLSNMDSLTELPNRSAFLNDLSTQLQSASKQKLGLIFIDLDGFKTINDSLGHTEGDQVLIEIAKRLKNMSTIQSICRWGGDEFVCFVLLEDEADLANLAATIIKLIEEPIVQSTNLLSISACIGISLYPKHNRHAQKLIEQADMAMYKAKHEKNSKIVIYSEALKNDFGRTQMLISGLKNAIKKNEFRLVYQPIVDSKTRKVGGFEALLRWTFGHEIIPPDVFIPLAEKTGLIVEIGEWVLLEACKQTTKWTDMDDYFMSINVSAVQIANKSLIALLEKGLMVSNFVPNRLHIEITESHLLQPSNIVNENIDKIKQMGIEIAIDDFGIGYSNLSQLKHLPANTLKIDRAFVNALASNDDVIIKAAMLIANDYHFKTVVEGIETEEQAKYIASTGATYMQGYLFAKPLEASDVEEWQQHNLNDSSSSV
jgi:diguanylate cyclase (GGDEF)-like protein